MMLEILESGKALYVLAAVCFLGLLSRLTARSLYRRLIRETDNMTLTKNRYLREFKQRTENTYRLNQGINNTQVYLEKQLASYRFLGLSLNGWSNLSSQLTVLCFLLGGAAAFGAYWYRCDNYYIVLYGTAGVLTGLLTLFVDCGVNLQEKRLQLLAVMQDYLENSLFNRLARETAATAEGGPRAVSRENSVLDGGKRSGIRGIVRGGHAEAAEQERNPDRNTENRNGEDGPSGAGTRKGGRWSGKGQQKEPVPASAAEKGGADANQEYLKRGLEQIAASREKGRSEGDWLKELSPDELELVGQILKQYLA